MSHYSPLISAFVTLLLTLILALNKEGLLQTPAKPGKVLAIKDGNMR